MIHTTINTADIAKWIVGAVLSIGTLIQISPIKINPWSAIVRWIGKELVGEQIAKLDKRMDNLEKSLEAQQIAFEKKLDEDGRDRAISRRYRILRFGDECTHNQPHTREMWDQAFEDITAYERYCAEHPGFLNEKTKLTEQIIRNAYQEAVNNNTIL